MGKDLPAGWPAGPGWDKPGWVDRDTQTKQSAAKQSSENILVLFQKTDQNE